MKKLLTLALLSLMMVCFATTASAQCPDDVINPTGTRYAMSDYGLKDDGGVSDQSAIMQRAMNEVNAKGGGIITIQKGTYALANIVFRSNVHLMIDAGTVIKHATGAGAVFTMDTHRYDKPRPAASDYIENVSIRGVGGYFMIDYHHLTVKNKCRGVVMTMVKNFMVENMIVKDNYTTHCGMCLSSTHEAGPIDDWKGISRPTNGLIRRCQQFNASPGYGLVQIHGAQSVHFEDLYSRGGVTLRLETGADYMHVGVFDLTADNIICEDGRCATMLGPHSAKNGVVTISNLTAISCEFAASVGDGGVKKGAPDQTPGRFSNESSIKGVKAIFGTKAQAKSTNFSFVPKAYADGIRGMKLFDNKFYIFPSLGGVNYTPITYSVKVEDVTLEGFKYVSKPIFTSKDVPQGSVWSFRDNWINSHSGEKYSTSMGIVPVDYDIPTLNYW